MRVSPPDFTLLICTLNRPVLLRQCIASLQAQRGSHSYEIVVVDQSDPGNEPEGLPEEVIYLHLDERGLSNARNVGFRASSGTYVSLIDDDAIYPEDYLESVMRAIHLVRADIVSGVIEDPDTHLKALPAMSDTGMRHIGFWNAMRYCMSAATTFARNLISEGEDAFDKRFGTGGTWGAGEETDLVWRSLLRGARVVFDPSIVVLHPVSSKVELPLEKIASYSVGFGALDAKHLVDLHNPRALPHFAYSLLRNVGGMLVYSVRDRGSMRVQAASLTSKVRGFRDYLASRNRVSSI